MREEQQQQPDLQREERSLTTVAQIAAPFVPVAIKGAEIVYDQIKNRPPQEEPPKIELPPGVEE